MGIANRYRGVCFRCQTYVRASVWDANGELVERGGTAVRDAGGLWRTLCLGCAPYVEGLPKPLEASVAPVKIYVELRGDAEIVVRPMGWLGDAWMKFKVACSSAGLTYVAELDGSPGNIAPVALAADVLGVLKAAGFVVEAHPTLVALLQAQIDRARSSLVTTDQRVTKLRTSLAERGLALYGYQETGIPFLAERTQAILADEMGLGKSAQALLASPEDNKLIVVSPASVRAEWIRQIETWRPDFLPVTPVGRKETGGNKGKTKTLFLSYQSLNEVVPEVPESTTLICDEIHNLKGGGKTWKWFRKLADVVLERKGRVWGLSGTPLLNREDELWCVLEAIGGLGKTLFGHRRRFKRVIRDDRATLVAKLRPWLLRRSKAEAQPYLPQRVYLRRDAPIGPGTKEQLDAILDQLVELAVLRAVQQGFPPENEVRANMALAIDWAFAGEMPVPFELMARVKSLLALAKTTTTQALLDELESSSEDAILCFTAHVPACQEIAHRPGWGEFTGDNAPTRERDKASFLAEDKRGLALTIRAGGSGLNLQRACIVVRNDLEWSPALNDQAVSRAHRTGQTRTVFVYDVVADHPLDERIHELNREKEKLIADTIDRLVRPPAERPASTASDLARAIEGVGVLKVHAPPAVKPTVEDPTHLARTESEARNRVTLLRIVSDPTTPIGDRIALKPMLKSIAGPGLTAGQWLVLDRICRRYQNEEEKA